MTDELKPCPFCGGKAELDSYSEELRDYYFIRCTNFEEGCCIEQQTYYEKEDSITAWNRRV